MNQETTGTNKITISEAKQLPDFESLTTKFLVRGRKYQEFFDSVEEALEYKDDEDRHGSYWLVKGDGSGFYELTDDDGNVL